MVIPVASKVQKKSINKTDKYDQFGFVHIICVHTYFWENRYSWSGRAPISVEDKNNNSSRHPLGRKVTNTRKNIPCTHTYLKLAHSKYLCFHTQRHGSYPEGRQGEVLKMPSTPRSAFGNPLMVTWIGIERLTTSCIPLRTALYPK